MRATVAEAMASAELVPATDAALKNIGSQLFSIEVGRISKNEICDMEVLWILSG